ncbi:MAG: hypothetical protein JW864_17595 [Spirochaetes bacterium]|nr:hypothetical protein [Spirochaetota bacterium]
MLKSIRNKMYRFSAFIIMLFILMITSGLLAYPVSLDKYGILEIAVQSDDNIDFDYDSGSSNATTHDYDQIQVLAGFYPSRFSLEITPDGGASITSVTANNGSYVQFWQEDSGTYYYVVYLADGVYTTVTIESTDGTVHYYYLNCEPPAGGSTGATTGVFAFCPAPGQFVNENIPSGGWGTIYTDSDTDAVKDMTDNINGTGVSLGYFGGYLVIDYGPYAESGGVVTSGIGNLDNHQYGVDFVLCGNPLSTFAEPGCVQVSNNGYEWYDIAGSLYYTSATTKGYCLRYENPYASDDDPSNSYGEQGQYFYDVYYTGSESYRVLANPFHRHSFYPLYCNYFTVQDATFGDLSKINYTPSLGFIDCTTEYSASPLVARVLEFTGNMIRVGGSGINDGDNEYDPADYTFGYCDVHRTTNVGKNVTYNPYDTSITTYADAFDISWAVYPVGHANEGEPVNLAGIQYIRIYTGTAQHNGAFGESSTEVTGSFALTVTGGAAPSVTPLINYGAITPVNKGTTNHSQTSSSANYTVAAPSATYFYVNGESVNKNGYSFSVSLTSVGDTAYYQIITQTGNESPHITVLKIIRTL